MRFAYWSLAAGLLVGTSLAGPVSSYEAPLWEPPAPPTDSPIGPMQAGQSHLVPDSYIVVLHKDQHHKTDEHLSWLQSTHAADVTAQADHTSFAGLRHSYDVGALKGYSGHFSQDVLAQIRARPEVAYVERDSVVWASELEKGAPWGLARLSHRKSLGFGTFNKYEYDEEAGEGVTAYVIDTGVNINHVEFEGRAKWGKTIPQNDQDIDANGHGTHCAGTIGSRKYGVAKKANIVAVKVLGSNGSGTMADVVGGVDWAASHAKKAAEEARANNNKAHRGSVANMSLGGGKSIALDEAVNAAVDTGLHFAVAAGNDNRDACTFSPAAAEGPITVGASTISDARAYFSNHGKCVDVFAPGLNILSTWNTGNTSINTISGTSMASPHVCGLMAYFLGLYPKEFQPSSEDYLMAGEVSPYEAEASGFFNHAAQSVFGQLAALMGYAPAPKKPGQLPETLSPKVLKNTLVRVATDDILTDLPANTINALIFNNYTHTGY